MPHPPVVYGVHLGTQNAHHTRKLFVYHGVVYCRKCGAKTAGHLLNYLARPCVPLTKWWGRNFAALRAGKLPPKLKQCPAPSSLYQDPSPEDRRIMNDLNRQIDEFKPLEAASSSDQDITHFFCKFHGVFLTTQTLTLTSVQTLLRTDLA